VVSVHNQVYDRLRYDTIYKQGNYYEEEVISRFVYILQENRNSFDYESTNTLPLVLDIGGNIGFYTLLSAAWQHAVLTFEINPSNIIRICESLHLNELNEHGFSDLPHSMTVRIHQQGVSDASGNTIRVEVPRNPGETSLDKSLLRGGDSGGTSERVFSTTTVTLDDFAAERGWLDRSDTTFSLVKIDTEGHEFQILMGAKKFIHSRRAKNILLEYRVHCRETMDILSDSGYVIVTSNKDSKGNVNRKMLTRNESVSFLDAETKRLRRSRLQYLDFWFRLDTLPL
jgi:FkbM family methyltransferase